MIPAWQLQNWTCPFAELTFPPRQRILYEKYRISRSGYLPKFHQMMPLPQKVTLQHHQMLRLPRKLALQHQKLTVQHHQMLRLRQKLHLPGKVTLQHHQVLRLPRKSTLGLQQNSHEASFTIMADDSTMIRAWTGHLASAHSPKLLSRCAVAMLWSAALSRQNSIVVKVRLLRTFIRELHCEMTGEGLPIAKVEDDPRWHSVTHRHIRQWCENASKKG